MKKLLLLAILAIGILCAGSISKDGTKCKKTDLVIMATDEMPEGYTIAGMGEIERVLGISNVTQLTADQIKHIRKYARMFKACTIFVDFNAVTPILDSERERQFQEKYVRFWCLQIDPSAP